MTPFWVDLASVVVIVAICIALGVVINVWWLK